MNNTDDYISSMNDYISSMNDYQLIDYKNDFRKYSMNEDNDSQDDTVYKVLKVLNEALMIAYFEIKTTNDKQKLEEIILDSWSLLGATTFGSLTINTLIDKLNKVIHPESSKK